MLSWEDHVKRVYSIILNSLTCEDAQLLWVWPLSSAFIVVLVEAWESQCSVQLTVLW